MQSIKQQSSGGLVGLCPTHQQKPAAENQNKLAVVKALIKQTKQTKPSEVSLWLTNIN
jgi:hypothetical protein